METSDSLRKCIRAIGTFRHFQILNLVFNQTFDITVAAHMVITSVIITSAAFGSIKYLGRLETISYTRLPLFAGLGITYACLQTPQSGVINTYCQSVRRIYKTRFLSEFKMLRGSKATPQLRTIKYTEYLLRVGRDMRVNLGGFYWFKKSTLFTFLDIIAQNTINLLITFHS